MNGQYKYVCLRSFKIKFEIGLMQDRALGERTQRRLRRGELVRIFTSVRTYAYDRCFIKIRSFFPEVWIKLWEKALTRSEESFLKFLDLDPEVDDFQNSISSSFSTDTSLVNFFYKDPIHSFYVRLLKI